MLASGEVPKTRKILYTATAKVEPKSNSLGSPILYNIWDSVTNSGVIVCNKDITTIGSSAFRKQSALTSIIIPDDVVIIDREAFSQCDSLEEITIGKSVHTIESNAFYGNNNVKKANVNQTIDSFLSIKYSIADNNYSFLPLDNAKLYLNGNLLTDLVIPEGATTILRGTLYNYPYLQSISIPASVTEIQTNALIGCNNLSYISVDNNNSIFDSRDNCNCLIRTSNNHIVLGSKNSIIPESVLYIDESAFNDIVFDNVFIIPNTVSLSPHAIFRSSSGPEVIVNCDIPSAYNLTYPNSVFLRSSFDKITINSKNIGAFAFYQAGMKEVFFTDGITAIGTYAFYSCNNVKYYDFSSCTSFPSITTTTFALDDIANVNCKIIVPDALYDEWITATNWSSYADYTIKKSDWDASQATE